MTLSAGEVHLWEVSLDGDEAARHLCERVLNDEEKGRAGRFHFERDRRRFITARGTLRMILGAYAGLDSGRLVFGYAERGKPFLVIPETRLRFNLSHSDGHALVALAEGREVGVDVEAGTRLGEDWRAIARRYFSEREQAELDALPAERRRAAFLHGWARKEAYLKAAGLGIADGLQKVEVSLDPEQPPVFHTPEISGRWVFANLWSEFPAAALVAERLPGDAGVPHLRRFKWGETLI